MKYLLVIVLAITLFGCLRVVPLRNEYPDEPYFFYSEKSPDRVWDDIIDVVTDNGLILRFIDRSSGFIMSDEITLARAKKTGERLYTVEDAKGQLLNNRAYVVTERLNTTPSMFYPEYSTFKWSIVVRETKEGNSAIKITIADIDIHDGVAHSEKNRVYRAYSLHNFERWLADQIK